MRNEVHFALVQQCRGVLCNPSELKAVMHPFDDFLLVYILGECFSLVSYCSRMAPASDHIPESRESCSIAELLCPLLLSGCAQTRR